MRLEGLRPIFTRTDSIVGRRPGGAALSVRFWPELGQSLFVAKSRSKAADGSLSQQEAAQFIGCDPQAVRGLTEKNLLAEVDGREGRRVTKESVHAFKEKYRALSDIAKQHGSSSRRLDRIRDALGIASLRVSRAGSRADIPFIEVRCVSMLVAHLHGEGPRYYGRGRRNSTTCEDI
jgi:hypothetical protein